MSNFIDALQEKVDELEDEKERIDEKTELKTGAITYIMA